MNQNYWKNKNIFVTGATGFLGSYLVKELVEQGARVIILERDYEAKSNFYRLGLDKRTIKIAGDIANYFLLERILNEYEIDLCFHLAAQPIVPTANRLPLSTFESNIKGTWLLLEAMRRSPLKPKLVVASSDKAYGDSLNLPYRETHPLKGSYPYDASKSCADILAQSYFLTYKLPVAIARCGNFYGGGDLNWSRIVPGTIKSVLFNQNPIIRSDGKLKRDYFYIKDTAAAYLAVGEKMENEKMWGEAFNFGTEIPTSALLVAEKIIHLSGKSHLHLEILGQNHGEIPEQYLATEKARDWLSWQPKYTLEQGLAETYKWYQEFLTDTEHASS